MHTAELVIDFDNHDIASIIHASLRPELLKNDIAQTTTKVNCIDNVLTLVIYAKTIPILRAAINSYSRWIETALRVQEI